MSRLSALLALLVLALAAIAQDPPPGKPPLGRPTGANALERFRELTPNERLLRAERAGGAKAFVSVTEGELDLGLTERGTVESADVADVICRVKGKGAVATTIKWLVEDGEMVKKGQRLAELDGAGLRDQLLAEEVALARAAAARLVAEMSLKLLRKERQLDARSAEIELKVARLELKGYTGADGGKKEILQLKVEWAQLAVEVIDLRGQAKEALAEADLKAADLAEKQQARKKAEAEEQLAACMLTAPHDGVAVHLVPEVGRFGAAGPVVAQGEPVREGQKLLRVVGLERFTVATRVSEAVVSRVRPGQQAAVRIDAFPGRTLRAQIKEVSPTASKSEWLARDVKVYPVVIELIDQARGLKPGMSAEVRSEGEKRPKGLLVPAEAVLRAGRQAYCFVKAGNGVEERKVTAAIGNGRLVEIKDGLKEGEAVLRDPMAAARAVAP